MADEVRLRVNGKMWSTSAPPDATRPGDWDPPAGGELFVATGGMAVRNRFSRV